MMYFLDVVRERWANFPHVLRFVAVVAVLLAGGFVLMVPVNQRFKEWRLQQKEAAAVAAFEAGAMLEARDHSLGAIVAGSGDVAMFRILERAMEAVGDHRHPALARNLYEHADATPEDRLRTFRMLCEITPIGSLGRMWLRLPSQLQHDPEFATAFAGTLLEEGLPENAAAVLMALPEAQRTDAVLQRLTGVMIGEGSDAALAEAFRWLARHWPEEGAEESGWLEVLESIPVERLDPQASRRVRLLMRSAVTDETPRLALGLARLDWAERFSQREAVVREAVVRWNETAPELLARMLAAVGADEVLLDTIPDERATEHPELLAVLMTAARRTGNWERFGQLLTVSAGSLTDWERAGHLAVMETAVKGAGEGNEAVRAALDEASISRDVNAFLGLQRIFNEAGLEEAATDALLQAMLRGRGRLRTYRQIRPVLNDLLDRKRDDLLLRIYQNYLDFEPGDPELTARFLYLAMLWQIFDATQAVERLELLGKAFPEDEEIHHFLAVAHLAAGDPAAAAAVLGPFQAMEHAPPRLRAIQLATAVANGDLAADDPQVQDFQIGTLLVAEARMFRESLALASRRAVGSIGD